MLFSELGKYIEKTVLLTFVIILLSTAAVVLANFMSASEKKVTLDEQDFKEVYADGSYFSLGDNLQGDVEKAFLEKENYLDILSGINTELNNCELFTYLEVRQDYTGIRDYKGEKSFSDIRDEMFYYAPNDTSYVNSVIMNKRAIEHFKLKIEEGRLFTEEEYYGENDPLPIILGSAYEGIYNVGDKIIMSNSYYAGWAVVIGILEEGITVVDLEYPISMDKYIVFPMKQLRENEELIEGKGLYRWFLQKNNGEIYSKYSEEDVQSVLDYICAQYGVQGAYHVPRVDNWWQAVFAENIEEVGKSYEKMAFWTGLAAILVLAVYSFVKVRLSYGYFGILMTCGARMKQIIGIILGEELVIIGFTVVNGLVLSKILCEKLYPKYEFSMTYGTAVIGIISLTGIVFALVGLLRKDIVLCLHDSLQSKK